MSLWHLKSVLIPALILLVLPATHLPAQERWADRWPCPRSPRTYRHFCTVGGRPTPYLLILIQNGQRREVLRGIRADIRDSIDDSDAGSPDDLFEDIKNDFLDDQESPDPFDIGYFDIDEVLRLQGTTFDRIIRAAVKEEFSLQSQSRAQARQAKNRIANRVVGLLNGHLPG